MAAQKNPLKNPKLLRLIANGLIAVGIIGAAAIAYQVWGTNVTSAVLAQQERTALQIEFSKPNNLVPSLVEPEASKSFALVTIPKLKVKDFPLVQGIEERDLARGFGHYPGTAMRRCNLCLFARIRHQGQTFRHLGDRQEPQKHAGRQHPQTDYSDHLRPKVELNTSLGVVGLAERDHP